MDHISRLEHASVHILREAYHNFPKLGMLWSIGKDSSVLVWLCRKAFFGHVPFPVFHVDTGFEIPEVIEYRDNLAKAWNLDIRYVMNEEAIAAKQTFPDGALDRVQCCRLLKTKPLADLLQGEGSVFKMNPGKGEFEKHPLTETFEGIIVGVRADEEGSRSKERYFSPRDNSNSWDISTQPPEFWNQFNTEFPPGTHLRIHPLLDWTEVDIWQYIEREKIPMVPLYFNQGNNTRYRSLGCTTCTFPVESKARNPEEIIYELSSGKFARIAERSGRAQDKDAGGGLEVLRKDGYM